MDVGREGLWTQVAVTQARDIDRGGAQELITTPDFLMKQQGSSA